MKSLFLGSNFQTSDTLERDLNIPLGGSPHANNLSPCSTVATTDVTDAPALRPKRMNKKCRFVYE
jgi:hypothetical protein